jgi:hypothetical protein
VLAQKKPRKLDVLIPESGVPLWSEAAITVQRPGELAAGWRRASRAWLLACWTREVSDG